MASRRTNQSSDLAARVLAAIPAIAFAVAIVVAGEWVFTAALIVLGWVCLHEAFAMLEAAHPVRLAGFIGYAGMLVAAHLGGPDAVLGALAATVPLTFLIALLQPRAGAAGLAVTAFALGWIGVALAHAVLLRDLPHGGGIVADILVGTFAGDTGAYFTGRAFGRRPLAPVISPNKTLEGLIGGFFFSILGVEAAALYQDWFSGVDALLLGLAVGAAAPLGDLFESYLKRDRGVKDAGRLFGAHGGALDRLDAVLFTAVAGYYVWLALMT
ncbi:MAG TPA: phosphatidate cytidylyltransferase [Solirubrobacteraceae bacterium]